MSQFQKKRSIDPETSESIAQQVQDQVAAKLKVKEPQANEAAPHLYSADQNNHRSDCTTKGEDQDTTKPPVIRRGHTVNEGAATAGAGQPTTQAPAQVSSAPDCQQQPCVPPQVDVYQDIKAATNEQRIFNNHRSERERTQKNRMKDHDEYQILQRHQELSRQPPIPIGDDIAIPDKFPLHVFPVWVQELILAVATFLSTPIEAVAPCLLGAMFIAARGQCVVQVKDGYTELLTEYIIVAMGSGTNKSGILKFFRNIFDEIEESLQATHNKNAPVQRLKLKRYKMAKEDLEASIIKGIRKAINEGCMSESDVDSCIEEYINELAYFEKKIKTLVVRPRITIDNPTPKELSLQMEAQGGSLGIFEGEPAFLKQRVNKRQNTILLKAYNGEPFTDETSTATSSRIEHPCLAIFSFSQPDVAMRLFSQAALKDDGLLPRMLPVFQSKIKGIQNPDAPPVPDALKTAYEDKIRSILKFSMPENTVTDKREVCTLTLTDEAYEIYVDFAHLRNMQMKNGEFENYEAFGSKLVGHAIRIAGAVHCLEHGAPWDQPISASAMKAGVAIAEFFAKHAKAIFDAKRLEAIEYANKVLKKFEKKKLAPLFNQRDAQRVVGHCKVAQIIAGLDLLEKNYYVASYTNFKNKTTYIVNPNILNTSPGNISHMVDPVPSASQVEWTTPAHIYG